MTVFEELELFLAVYSEGNVREYRFASGLNPRIRLGVGYGNELELVGNRIGRVHAVLEVGGGTISLVDMGTILGTKVNGLLVERVLLNHGDEIGIADVVIRCGINERIITSEATTNNGQDMGFGSESGGNEDVEKYPVVDLQLLSGGVAVQYECLSMGETFRIGSGKRSDFLWPITNFEETDFSLIEGDGQEKSVLKLLPGMVGVCNRQGGSHRIDNQYFQHGSEISIPLNPQDFGSLLLEGLEIRYRVELLPALTSIGFTTRVFSYFSQILVASLVFHLIFILGLMRIPISDPFPDHGFVQPQDRFARLLVSNETFQSPAHVKFGSHVLTKKNRVQLQKLDLKKLVKKRRKEAKKYLGRAMHRLSHSITRPLSALGSLESAGVAAMGFEPSHGGGKASYLVVEDLDKTEAFSLVSVVGADADGGRGGLSEMSLTQRYQKTVQRQVHRYLDDIQRCYITLKPVHGDSHEEISLVWEISQSGKVKGKPKIHGMYKGFQRVRHCMQTAIKAWQFESHALGKSIRVEYTFRLTG
ncbi:MAG: AgmX/PglI C-terminal domain-containing protein [Myxococcota bacterium]|nr:AgmX/PglI C-terminal domain-containing protein [Myxococcota bacterium]